MVSIEEIGKLKDIKIKLQTKNKLLTRKNAREIEGQ